MAPAALQRTRFALRCVRANAQLRELRPFVKTPGQYALLRVQAVFGLVEHHRLRAVDHLVGDLLAAMRGQAVHEDRIILGQRHQLRIDLIGLEHVVAVFAVLVAHRDPRIGDDAIDAADGGFGIVAEHDRAPASP